MTWSRGCKPTVVPPTVVTTAPAVAGSARARQGDSAASSRVGRTAFKMASGTRTAGAEVGGAQEWSRAAHRQRGADALARTVTCTAAAVPPALDAGAALGNSSSFAGRAIRSAAVAPILSTGARPRATAGSVRPRTSANRCRVSQRSQPPAIPPPTPGHARPRGAGCDAERATRRTSRPLDRAHGACSCWAARSPSVLGARAVASSETQKARLASHLASARDRRDVEARHPARGRPRDQRERLRDRQPARQRRRLRPLGRPRCRRCAATASCRTSASSSSSPRPSWRASSATSPPTR